MTSRVRLSITLPAMEVMLTQHFSSALCEDWSDTGFSAVLKHLSHSLFTFRDNRVRQSFLPAPSALLGASCCSPWICVCQIYLDDLWTDTPWQKSSLPFPRLSYPHGLGFLRGNPHREGWSKGGIPKFCLLNALIQLQFHILHSLPSATDTLKAALLVLDSCHQI